MPELLAAALNAWIAERDADQAYTCDPPPGRLVALHARLRQSLDPTTEDERHWSFRAIAATNARCGAEPHQEGLQCNGTRGRTDASCSSYATRRGRQGRRRHNSSKSSTTRAGAHWRFPKTTSAR